MTWLPDAVFGPAGLLAAEGGDGVRTGDGPAHSGLRPDMMAANVVVHEEAIVNLLLADLTD